MTFDDIARQIKALPPLSPSVLKIRRLYAEGSENVDVTRLIRLIEADVSLAANVLKLINDPKYGFAKRISSVAQAVTLLGTEMVYGIVIDKAMREHLKADVRPYGLDSIEFNDMCHLQSALLIQWYSRIDKRDAQFLAHLALIMELGKLIVAKEVAESDYTAMFLQGLKEARNIQKYEFELLETTSYYISALLFEYWNLNPLFGEILKIMDFKPQESNERMEHYRNILDSVRTAINVKEFLSFGSIDKAARKLKKLGLSESAFLDVAYHMKRMYEQSRKIEM